MLQTGPVLKTLKKELKGAGLTYSQVGQALGLSEASIKRLFISGNISLPRLEQICDLIGINFSYLMQKAVKSQTQLELLSYEQEQIIADDLLLLLVAISVMNGMTMEDLLTHYQLSEPQCIQKLAQLDKMQFLQLLPGNRIRMLLSGNFRWQVNGPIQQFFFNKVEKEFFASQFADSHEKLLVLNGICTRETNQALQQLMEKFAAEFNALMKKDIAEPGNVKKGNTMVLALREWQFGLFRDLQRPAT